MRKGLQTDLLIIGAGLSGAVVARRLSEASFQVTCIEQGRWHQKEDYPGKSRKWELMSQGSWHGSPNYRGRSEDYPINDTESDMKPMLFNGVGGSTILFGAHWMRMLPSDFRTHTIDGVANDWPVNYEELSPYYDQVDTAFGVSGISGDPAFPPRSDFPMPPLPIGKLGEKVAKAHHRLGWHWWPGSNAIASRPYLNRRPCVQRSTCGTGCNEGAKASTDLTHWPLAIQHGAQLLTNSRVTNIISTGNKVTGAVFIDSAGNQRHISAKLIVMAASAIGTPRLLLNSEACGQNTGISNSSGLVGRRLMMHPFTRVVGLFDEHLDSTQGHWGQSIYSMEFAETRSNSCFVRGAKWNLSPSGGPLQAALFPSARPLWEHSIHSTVEQWLGRSAIWGISCEDLPDDRNRLILDEELIDTDDMPAPRLLYRLSENTRLMLKFNIQKAKESLVEAGAHETLSSDLLPEYGWHPLGTCCMGNDPSDSVVNRFGQSHDIANLFIADGSTFVTGSSVNPAATIAALALRTADHIIENRRVLAR